MKIRSAVIIIKTEGQILLLKRHDFDHNLPGWCLPGGKLDEEEVEIDAAVRETKEETGIVLSLEEIKLLGVYESTLKSRSEGVGMRQVDVSVFEVQLTSKPDITISDEHSAYGWFTLEEIKIMQEKQLLAGKTWNAFNI